MKRKKIVMVTVRTDIQDLANVTIHRWSDAPTITDTVPMIAAMVLMTADRHPMSTDRIPMIAVAIPTNAVANPANVVLTLVIKMLEIVHAPDLLVIVSISQTNR